MYKAEDRKINRTVALRVLAVRLLDSFAIRKQRDWQSSVAPHRSKRAQGLPWSLVALALIVPLVPSANADSGPGRLDEISQPPSQTKPADPGEPSRGVAREGAAADAASEEGEAPTAVPAESNTTERTALNLLGEVDSSAGESRRNENVQITLIDNNVLNELNRRMGTTTTVVREFQVDRGYFGAEFGGPPTSSLHLDDSRVSRVHGSLYGSHNNSVFSARSFFQVGDVQPARSNDYGFRFGAPLWRGSDIFFDGSQQRIRGSVNGNVLVLAPDERTPLAQDPATRAFVQQIIDAFPAELPNRTDINPRALNTSAPQKIDNDAIATRLDQVWKDNDRLSLGYSFKKQKVDAFQLVSGQNPNTTTRSHDSRITWNRAWSAATTSDVSLGFNRVTSLLIPDETNFGPEIYTSLILEGLNNSLSIPIDRAQNRFRYAARVRHVRGRHRLTTGFDVFRKQMNGVESSSHLGGFSFGDDFEDELGRPRDAITNLRLGSASEFLLGIGNVHRGFRYWDLQAFVGDDWQVQSNLTLHFGLRYQPLTKPIEVNALTDIPYSCDCNNVAPRFGFAYRINETWGAIRGAYGMHFGEIFPVTFGQARFNPPGNLRLRLAAPSLINPLEGVIVDPTDPDARASLFVISPDLVAPYSHQYNFSWELNPARDWTLQLGYVGSRSHRLISMWASNRARPVAGIPLLTSTVNDRRPDPKYFENRDILNGSRAYFDAARVTLTVPGWQGLSSSVSYWISKAIDLGAIYSSTGNPADSARGRSQTEFDVHGDVKALSEFDQSHAFLWRVVYQTPALGGRRTWTRRMFGRWELFSVVLLKSGTPVTVTSGSDGPGFGNVDGAFADRVHILDPSILGRSIDHPDTSAQRLPHSAFAFIQPGEQAGNIGRNTFRKDGIHNINFAVSRNWKIAAEKILVFRVESINLFNAPQFAEPGLALSSPSFGEITNTLNDGRTFRFLLQFAF